MASLQQIVDRKKEVSGQVSTQTRTLALGQLAIAWALLTVHDEPLRTMALHVSRVLILALAVCAVVVIVCDLLQYVAATAVAQNALQRAEKSESKTAFYEKSSFAYRAQGVLYHAKFYCLSAGSVILLIAFIGLFRASSAPIPQPSTAHSPASAVSTK